MPIQVVCPAGHRFAARESQIGDKVLCPQCQLSVIVPRPASLLKPAALPAAQTRADRPLRSGQKPQPAERQPSAEKTVSADRIALPKASEPPAPSGGVVDERKKAVRPPAPPPRKAAARAADVSPVAAAPPLPAQREQQNPQPPIAPAATADSAVETAPATASETDASDNRARREAAQPMMVFDLGQHPETSGYRADRNKVVTVRWMAVLLLCITLVGAAPAAPYYHLAGAPWWAILVLLIAVLQIIYIAWMATLPDWSSVWVLMLVFAVSAAVYGFALAVVLVAQPTPDMPLQLYSIRRLAVPWCAAMVLLTFLGAYVCGRVSHRWHRSHIMALKAGYAPRA